MRPVVATRISQPFADPGSYASRTDRHGKAGHHTGLDIASRWPVPINLRLVRSCLPGEVVFSEYNSWAGNWIGVYTHDLNLLVTYWHLSSRKVVAGDWVQVYAPIGRVGSTGNSTAPHLHLQVNYGREFDYHGHVDPSIATYQYSRKVARDIYRENKLHPQSR